MDFTKASTCCSIFVNTLNEPELASCKTSPKVDNKLAEVVSSQHEQITDGVDKET